MVNTFSNTSMLEDEAQEEAGWTSKGGRASLAIHRPGTTNVIESNGLKYPSSLGLRTIWSLIFHQRRFRDVFFYERWRDEMFAKWCLQTRAQEVEKTIMTDLPNMLNAAEGKIVLVGAGSTFNLVRLTASKITRIWCIEPNGLLQQALRESIGREGLNNRAVVVPGKLNDAETLAKYGLQERGCDFVICLDCLCAVDNLEEAVSAIYRLLRPGGRLIVWQHMKHFSLAGQLWQGKHLPIERISEIKLTFAGLWNVIWPLVCNCHLNRPIREAIMGDGTPWFQWREYQIVNEHNCPYPWFIFPVYAATFTKVGTGGRNPALESLGTTTPTDRPSNDTRTLSTVRTGGQDPVLEPIPSLAPLTAADRPSDETAVGRPDTTATLVNSAGQYGGMEVDPIVNIPATVSEASGPASEDVTAPSVDMTESSVDVTEANTPSPPKSILKKSKKHSKSKKGKKPGRNLVRPLVPMVNVTNRPKETLTAGPSKPVEGEDGAMTKASGVGSPKSPVLPRLIIPGDDRDPPRLEFSPVAFQALDVENEDGSRSLELTDLAPSDGEIEWEGSF
ncbi:MAG: hypothetical protein M1823_005064 [Watsoniomyces obsoletus]|nr:MAG: hypothetical protein M1823_005064 [Watsoniomyces obsoletus]